MNLRTEIQLLLDWVRVRLLPDFKSDALDTYTDDYHIAFDDLLDLATNMRKAAEQNDTEAFAFFKKCYLDLFSKTSLKIISSRLDNLIEDYEGYEDESYNELSYRMRESMAIEALATKDFAHNYWMNLLDDTVPLGYADTRKKSNEMSHLRTPFFKGDKNANNNSHTDIFHNNMSSISARHFYHDRARMR
jgi:hypothetical protein